MTEFHCARCGHCCRWPGEVRLTQDDIRRAAELLGLTEACFIERYTRLRQDRSGLALTDRKESSDCVFFADNPVRCLVQEAKPQQCRDFPLRWNFPGWEQECAGSASSKGEKTTCQCHIPA